MSNSGSTQWAAEGSQHANDDNVTVDTQKQTDSKNSLRIKTAYKQEEEAENALKINLE